MGRDLGVILFLAAAIAAVYGPVARSEFVDYDDNDYVLDNEQVRDGLTWDGAAWAFTATEACNWHPLTWLSHMLDVQLFGLRPAGHHGVNVLLHIANSVLLYLVLKRMTAAPWRSAVVAALFALHPTHVESVAWVAERKDVLSTLFGLLALGAYARYAAQPGRLRWVLYVLVALLLALGLTAKPMLVTLPFLMLLLDYWPLARWRWGENVGRRMLEKVPFFVLAAASSVVTYAAQARGGAMVPSDILPFGQRLANGVVSSLAYVGKMLWPSGLAVIYPFPESTPAWQWASAAAALAVICAAVVWAGRRHRYLAVGWFWYLGMLVPVLGLVQVGEQGMADRYTYLPFVGLFIAGVWGVAEAAGRLWADRDRGRTIGLAVAAAAALLACGLVASRQVGYWRDSETLFRRALDVTTDNAVANGKLGMSLAGQNRHREAIGHFCEAIRLRPGTLWGARVRVNLGNSLIHEGRRAEAIAQYQEALRVSPDLWEGHYNLGAALAEERRFADAAREYRLALRAKPRHPMIRQNLGVALAIQGQFEEAVEHFRAAIRYGAPNAEVYSNLGLALTRLGRFDEAVLQFREALRRRPDSANVHLSLGLAMAQRGDVRGAAAHFAEALRLDPALADAHTNLGVALGLLGRPEEAIAHYREAIRLKANDPVPCVNLAWIRATHPEARIRDGAEAVAMATQACALTGRKDPLALDRLAAAYAEAGRFSEAVAAAEAAAALAKSTGAKDLAADIDKRLQQYKAGQPWRDVSSTPQVIPSR